MTRKTNMRIVIEELMRGARTNPIKFNILWVCEQYFGYDRRKVTEILGNIGRDINAGNMRL